MGKIILTINESGIQVVSFFGQSEEERVESFLLYSTLEKELHRLDNVLKNAHENQNEGSNEKGQRD